LALARDDAAAGRQPAARERILIVEDDFLIVMQMEGALEDAGYEVVGIAASAEEALELASVEQPLLCVMDISLAGKRDGIDAALNLFRQHGIRCIFATAHYDSDARRRAVPAAPLAWLPKPFSMASLVTVVGRAIDELRGKKM
jgi:DNA-binding NarL/FixJ family response regulator